MPASSNFAQNLRFSVVCLTEGKTLTTWTSTNQTDYELQINDKGRKINDSCLNLFDCAGKLLCYDGVCQCSPDHYWNGTHCLMRKILHDYCEFAQECQETRGCNKTCICYETEYWNGLRCLPRKTVNTECLSREQCQNTLYCARQICQCPVTDFWNGAKCSLRKSRNSECSFTFECKDTLLCNGTRCDCCLSDYWNGTLCLRKRSANEICETSEECQEKFVCVDETCRCPVGYYWDTDSCFEKKIKDTKCTFTEQCLDSLLCIDQKCQCDIAYSWTGTACVKKKSIGRYCFSSAECKDGMQCSNSRCRCKTTFYWDGSQCRIEESECEDIMTNNGDGVYVVYPKGGTNQISVYCKMDGKKKWTVIQRRFDGSVDFYRPWKYYKNGFGLADGEYWIGNDNIHLITQDGPHELSIYIEDWNNNYAYANYSSFMIGSEDSKYLVNISGYNGDAGDGFMQYYNGQKFTTYDQDNDAYGPVNCAVTASSAWWFNACPYQAQVNGIYNGSELKGFHWYKFKNNRDTLRKSTMMIRRK